MIDLYVCEVCGKQISTNLSEKVITRTDRRTGDKIHVCPECFNADMGVDYDTYAGRKARAQIGCFGIPLGLITSVLLFFFYGVGAGLAGLAVTFIIYRVASQGD